MMRVYRVLFPVRPTPQHPRYWELEFGYLGIWLTSEQGESAEAVTARAVNILEELPYEMPENSTKVNCQLLKDEQVLAPADRHKIYIEQVLGLGVAFMFAACPTGTEEGDFFDQGGPIPALS